MEQQVKSKKRVADHGEVFTAEREVKAMCDLVKNETERIDSRFLEPACGEGNFLVEILRRKLEIVEKVYKPTGKIYGQRYEDYDKTEAYILRSLMSIYGVDLLQDNVEICRARLFEIADKTYKKLCKQKCTDEFRMLMKFVLLKNILCGNALTLKRVDENAEDLEDPIIFAEWAPKGEKSFVRRDFRLDVLMREHEDENMYDTQLSLFGDTTDYTDLWDVDPVTKEPIPKPIKVYPEINYRRIAEYE